MVPDTQVGASAERSQTDWANCGKSSVSRRPVTPAMLEKLQEAWAKKSGQDSRMLWAAFSTCYFGCLRAGEVTTPENGEFDSGVHLRWQDDRQGYLYGQKSSIPIGRSPNLPIRRSRI